MKSRFFSLLFRMKYINRWALMRNVRYENLKEHSFDVAVITHALCVIGNKEKSRNYNTEKAVVYALYHDATEIFTGDMPTPIKYYNPDIKSVYKDIEKEAENKLLSYLPDSLREDYILALNPNEEELLRLVKAADRIAAIIKCREETEAGNKEFSDAEKAQLKALKEMKLYEADRFIELYLDSFSLPIDRM